MTTISDEEMKLADAELLRNIESAFAAYRKRTGIVMSALSAVTAPVLHNGRKHAYICDVIKVQCSGYKFDRLDPERPVLWPVPHENKFEMKKLEWVEMEAINDQK